MAIQQPALGLDELEAHRRELTGYCYRMLGSGFDAEDAVQETMVRAWRAADAVRGSVQRAIVVVPDRHQRVPRHAPWAPTAGPPDGDGAVLSPVEASLANRLADNSWISPVPDERIVRDGADPAEVAATRESIRLAFVAALQHLPARQRAVLILCEVLRWQATEVADLLDTTGRRGQQRPPAGPGHHGEHRW